MLASLILAFREGLEASLIVGILLGYLRKIEAQQYRRYVWLGVGLAVAASLLVAGIIQLIGYQLEGRAEELFEGIVMLIAVGVLSWMVFWMRYQAQAYAQHLQNEIAEAIGQGQLRGLTSMAFLAVFREGVELALFLSAAVFLLDGAAIVMGTILGLAAAVLVGVLIFITSIRLDVRAFFQVTSVILLLFAAGLLAHGVHELQEAGVVPIIIEHVWDVNHILDENSTLGELLKTLVGYNGNPSLLEVIAYLLYWPAALLGIRWRVDRVIAQRLTEAGV
jgi:high-affinity iron transporter